MTEETTMSEDVSLVVYCGLADFPIRFPSVHHTWKGTSFCRVPTQLLNPEKKSFGTAIYNAGKIIFILFIFHKWINEWICYFTVVRQLLQSATPPHWGTSPMAVRAIPGYTCRRVPPDTKTGSNSVLRAAIYSTIGIGWQKCIKRLKPENRKRSFICI